MTYKKCRGAGVMPVYFCNKDENLKFMLGQRAPQLKDGGEYDFFGGGRDTGETILQCVKRESKEEAGLTVNPKSLIPCSILENNDGYYQVFLLNTLSPIRPKLNEKEVSHADYWTLSDLKKLPLHDRVKDTIKSPQFKILSKSLYMIVDREDLL